MAYWELASSSSSSVDLIIIKSVKPFGGSQPSDRYFIPSDSPNREVTLSAKHMTKDESDTELAKLGTSQTYTLADGESITGIVVSHSDQYIDGLAMYNVTVGLKIPYIA